MRKFTRELLNTSAILALLVALVLGGGALLVLAMKHFP